MSAPVDLTTVVPVIEMKGDSETDTSLLQQLADEARQFLVGFQWCRAIEEEYFGCGVGGIVAVFLFRIVPATVDIDTWLWAIVGDLPPAYLVTDESRTPGQALRTYIAEMRRWVSAAQSGDPVEDLIPVNVPATPEWASRLSGRLDLLEEGLAARCR